MSSDLAMVGLLGGMALAWFGVLWLVVLQLHAGQGMLYTLFVPWAMPIFIARHWRKTRWCLLLCLFGMWLAVLSIWIDERALGRLNWTPTATATQRASTPAPLR